MKKKSVVTVFVLNCPKGWSFKLYHLESRWHNSHVLVYHGPLQIATELVSGVAPSTFSTVKPGCDLDQLRSRSAAGGSVADPTNWSSPAGSRSSAQTLRAKVAKVGKHVFFTPLSWIPLSKTWLEWNMLGRTAPRRSRSMSQSKPQMPEMQQPWPWMLSLFLSHSTIQTAISTISHFYCCLICGTRHGRWCRTCPNRRHRICTSLDPNRVGSNDA